MYKQALVALSLTALVSGSALAAVSAEEAARLGKDLTLMGAEMSANADGSIPAWNSEDTPIPSGFVPGSDNYLDPYAGEKPLYTIDGSNWQEYADMLTEGTKAIFEKYGAVGCWPCHEMLSKLHTCASQAANLQNDFRRRPHITLGLEWNLPAAARAVNVITTMFGRMTVTLRCLMLCCLYERYCIICPLKLFCIGTPSVL